MKAIFAATGLALLASSSAMAATAGAADCPSAHEPYSSRTILLDLVIDPRTRAILDRAGVLASVPPDMIAPSPPTFGALVSPRRLLAATDGPRASGQNGEAVADELDRALAQVPVTAEAAARRCARYDHVAPSLPRPTRHPAILVFEKITGVRDAASPAAHQAFAEMAARRGWEIAFTENGAVFNPAQLRNYDVVVWNNNSGDVLTLSQRKAFETYIAQGGGFAAVHGAGGDPTYDWTWYQDTLLGAKFTGHPREPQHYQPAKVIVEGAGVGIAAKLPASWTLSEEWYSFAASPRLTGAHVVARLDEATYVPGARLAMGSDHPIAWTRCIRSGRAFYTAIGHRPESYADPNSRELIEAGIAWAAGAGATTCRDGREAPARTSR